MFCKLDIVRPEVTAAASRGPAGRIPSRRSMDSIVVQRPGPVAQATPRKAPELLLPNARVGVRVRSGDEDEPMDDLRYFCGDWKVQGLGWTGEMRVTRPMACWQLTELSLHDSLGNTRKVSMRDAFDPINEHFVRRKEADSGSWFDYESVGWVGWGGHALMWEGMGHNFYGRDNGRVRTLNRRVDENTFRATDYVEEGGAWRATYSLLYTRYPAEDVAI